MEKTDRRAEEELEKLQGKLARFSMIVSNPYAHRTDFTDEQREILRLASRGHSARLIAQALGYCEDNVATKLARLQRRLHLTKGGIVEDVFQRLEQVLGE